MPIRRFKIWKDEVSRETSRKQKRPPRRRSDAIFYCFTEPTQRHKSCLKLLIEMGADVNNRNRQGVPNLVHACATSEENEEFCIDLIRAGADVRLVDEVKRGKIVVALLRILFV